jgi:hypothetical protein
MSSIRLHYRHRALMSCWDMQPYRMVPEASLVKVYNLLRGLIPKNRIRISSRHFLRQEAHSVPCGPVRLVACVMMRGLADEVDFISGGASRQKLGLTEAREFIAL